MKKWRYRYLAWCLGPYQTSVFDIVRARKLFTTLDSSATAVTAAFDVSLQFESLQCKIFVLWQRHTVRLSRLPSVTLSLFIFILFFSARIYIFFFSHKHSFSSSPLSLSGLLSFCLSVCEPDLLSNCLLKPRLPEWFVFEPGCSC